MAQSTSWAPAMCKVECMVLQGKEWQLMTSGSRLVWRDERREWKTSLTRDALDAPLDRAGDQYLGDGKSGKTVTVAFSAPKPPYHSPLPARGCSWERLGALF